MKELLDQALLKSDACELYKKEEETLDMMMVQGEVCKINGKRTGEIALRLIKDNKMGSAVSTDAKDKTIIERALISCQHQKDNSITFSAGQPSFVKCYDKKVAQMSHKDMATEGERILEIFRKYKFKVIPDIYIAKNVKNVHIINSNGFDHQYDKTEYSVAVAIKTEKGFIEVMDKLASADIRQLEESDIRNLIEKYHASQNRVNVKTGKMPVIFSGKAMGALMMRFLAGVKGSNILKHISPLEGKLGQKIFADGITVRDDGTMDWGAGSCAFDDEGVAASNTILVERGVLKNYLAGISEAEKLSIKPTGNSFKRTAFSQDIEDAPETDSSNMLLEGCNIPDEELIGSVPHGIYVDTVMGAHTGNIIAGQYSFNISCGYLIEDGKLAGKLMNTMVAGNIYEDFQKIRAMGMKQETMQAMFYPMGYSPAVLFHELSIVGQ